jgi:hypothetical protein
MSKDPAKPIEEHRCYVSSTPNATKSGKIKSLAFLDNIRNRPDLLGLWEFIEAGADVIGPEHGQPSWLCEIALVGRDGSENLLAEMTATVDAMLADVADNYYH